MSVFKRGKVFSYSFQIKGRPFFGTTGAATKEEALAVEKIKRAEAVLLMEKFDSARSGNMTFDAALERLWDEVGRFYKGTSRKTFETTLEWLLLRSGIGAKTKLKQIGKSKISEAIGHRRGDGVSNGTVNRTCTQPLRLLLRRARLHWEQEVQEIDWRVYMLKEQKERVKSLTSQDQPKLFEAMRADYLPAIRFMIKSGFRKHEVVNLKKEHVDFGNRRIAVRGKGDKPDYIPLSTELREIIWPLMGNPTDHVFTFIAPKTSVNPATKQKYIRGQHYPITYSGLGSAWRRHGAAKAGIADFHLHDLRHTAATRLARGGKANIRVVQRLMRHEDIATTAKYMHAYDEDVLEAMEAESKAQEAIGATAAEAPLQDALQDESKSA